MKTEYPSRPQAEVWGHNMIYTGGGCRCGWCGLWIDVDYNGKHRDHNWNLVGMHICVSQPQQDLFGGGWRL